MAITRLEQTQNRCSNNFIRGSWSKKWIVYIIYINGQYIWEIDYSSKLSALRICLRPCHTRQFSVQLATQWRCIASCKENFLVWHPMFATGRSSFYFSQCYATSCSVWHPHCNLFLIFLRRNQSQYDIIRIPLTFLNNRRA